MDKKLSRSPALDALRDLVGLELAREKAMRLPAGSAERDALLQKYEAVREDAWRRAKEVAGVCRHGELFTSSCPSCDMEGG